MEPKVRASTDAEHDEMKRDFPNTFVKPRAIRMNMPLFGIAEYWLQTMIPFSTNANCNNKVYIVRVHNRDDSDNRVDITAIALNKQVKCTYSITIECFFCYLGCNQFDFSG